MKSPVFNYCLKVNIDGHTRPKNDPILFLQLSVGELCNSLVSDPVDGGQKEARDVDNNIIISDFTLLSLLPPQIRKCQKDTSSSVVVSVLYLPTVYIPHYCHGVVGILKIYISKPKCSE